MPFTTVSAIVVGEPRISYVLCVSCTQLYHWKTLIKHKQQQKVIRDRIFKMPNDIYRRNGYKNLRRITLVLKSSDLTRVTENCKVFFDFHQQMRFPISPNLDRSTRRVHLNILTRDRSHLPSDAQSARQSPMKQVYVEFTIV